MMRHPLLLIVSGCQPRNTVIVSQVRGSTLDGRPCTSVNNEPGPRRIIAGHDAESVVGFEPRYSVHS